MREFVSLSEYDLVLMINQGHHGAFLEIYHRYKGILSANILRIVKTSELAEEILQDVFMMLWERRESMDPHLSISGYLYRAAVNKTKNIFRQLANDLRMREDFLQNLERSQQLNVHQLLEEKDVKKTLYSLLEKLPPQQRKVFMLCKLEGMSYQEVSQKLQISETTVNSHIRNANKLLRHEIEKKPNLTSVLYAGLLIFILL